jgi:hypothetical protein
MSQLSLLSNDALVRAVDALVRTDRQTLASLLVHLAELGEGVAGRAVSQAGRA